MYKSIKLLENIDSLRTKIVLKAEKKCRKRLSGKVAYAPKEVQHFGRLITVWSMVIDKKSNKTISSKKIKRNAKN